MTTAALWAAVDALTQPRQIRLTRDNGQHDWTQTPSLWQQLTDALPTGQEQGTGGHSSSYRTPISVDCLDLRTDIHTTVLDALHGHDQHPRRNGIAIDIPASIRHLASIVIATNDDDLTHWWTWRITHWSQKIIITLGVERPPQPRRIRDTPCPLCHATHITLKGADGPQRVPALLIDFADGLIRAAECGACSAAWFRGDPLLDLGVALTTRRQTEDAGGQLDVVC